MSYAESEDFKDADREPQENMQKFASLTVITLSANEKGSERLGGLEFVVLAFKRAKVLLIKLPAFGVSVGLRMNRSALGEHIYRKIVDIFNANTSI